MTETPGEWMLCPTCKGAGEVARGETCDRCAGKGRMLKPEGGTLVAIQAWRITFSCPCGFSSRFNRAAIPEDTHCPECGIEAELVKAERGPDGNLVTR